MNSMTKQIEEMANVTKKRCKIDNRCGSCHWSTCNECLSEALYNAGYRKESDVAMEIAHELEKFAFAEIAEERMCYDRAKEKGEPTRYFEGRIHAYELFLLKIGELYESEGADDDT